MALLAVTPLGVAMASGGTITNATAGESLTQGDCVFLHTDSKWYKANSVSDGSLVGQEIGIILCSASSGGRAIVASTEGDEVVMGATVTKGTWWCVASSDGDLEPYADVGAGENVIFVGYGSASENLLLSQHPTGYTK